MMSGSDEFLNDAKLHALWQIASGAPVSSTLDELARALENASTTPLRVCILQLNRGASGPEPPMLRFAAAPSMGDAFRTDVDGSLLRFGNSPSADAFMGRERILIADGMVDPRCTLAVRAVYERHGIQAVWIEPLISLDHESVNGVICFYPDRAGLPTDDELKLLEFGAQFAGLALERENSDRKLSKSESAMQHVLAGAKCLLWYATVIETHNIDFPYHWMDIRVWNQSTAQDFFPVDVAPYDGSYVRAWVGARDPQDAAMIDRQANRAFAEGRSGYLQEYRCRDRYGSVRWLREDVRLELLSHGHWSAVGVCVDVTDRKMAELERETTFLELSSSRQQYRDLFQNVPTGVYRLSPDGRFLLANPALATMLGHANADELMADSQFEAEGRVEFQRRLEMYGELRGYEAIWRRKDGANIVLRENARVVRDDQGAVRYYEGTVEDITEIRQVEARMRKQATHDALTGLPNRSLFMQTLEQTLAAAEAWSKDGELGNVTMATHPRPAVLFIDLDRFKQVNDTLGHDAGDSLLQTMARRLLRSLRGGETVARLGGDEFVILLPHSDTNSALRTARRIRTAAAKTMVLHGQEVYVAASIGISLYGDDGMDAATLLKNADTAMYHAKEEGGNGCSLYTPAMGEAVRERATVETDLRQAIRRGDLSLLYQPQYDLITGRMVGVEALVRWRHKERGIVSPGNFIPVAEETGLIEPLGEWILQQACQQGVLWSNVARPLRVSVNLSARQFAPRNRLAEQVERVLKETRLPASLLDLEITESVLLAHNAPVPETLSALKNLGVRLLLDDFGTGYGSLLYLRQFPLDMLKVDQSFVQGLSRSNEDAAIVRAVIDLAHALGMGVIAEGVETDDQRAELILLGCDAMQGYLFAAPLPSEEITRRLMEEG